MRWRHLTTRLFRIWMCVRHTTHTSPTIYTVILGSGISEHIIKSSETRWERVKLADSRWKREITHLDKESDDTCIYIGSLHDKSNKRYFRDWRWTGVKYHTMSNSKRWEIFSMSSAQIVWATEIIQIYIYGTYITPIERKLLMFSQLTHFIITIWDTLRSIFDR